MKQARRTVQHHLDHLSTTSALLKTIHYWRQLEICECTTLRNTQTIPGHLLCCSRYNSHYQSASTMVTLGSTAVSTFSPNPIPFDRTSYLIDHMWGRLTSCCVKVYSYFVNPAGIWVGAFATYIPFTIRLPAPLTLRFIPEATAVDR